MSLIETITALALTAILVTISAYALRTFWLERSLKAAADDVQQQFRQLQERAESESNPLVYGAWFDTGSSSWGLVRYNPAVTPTTCARIEPRFFGDGVKVTAVSIGTPDAALTAACRTALGDVNAQLFFFYARGTATGGSLTVTQGAVGKSKQVVVTAMTGRVVQQ
jgi:type II secretory pathway pseudopilin PulG